MDPARAGAEAAKRMAPERAEDVREALTYQYGRNLDCPPPDTPIELAKGYTLSKAKSKVLRNCWSSQRCTPDLALVMFNAARGDGTRVHYGMSSSICRRLIRVRALHAGGLLPRGQRLHARP